MRKQKNDTKKMSDLEHEAWLESAGLRAYDEKRESIVGLVANLLILCGLGHEDCLRLLDKIRADIKSRQKKEATLRWMTNRK